MEDAALQVTAENFRKEVVEAQGPVFVEFYAELCVQCRYLEPIIERLSQRYASRVKFARVDTERCRDIAEAYRIRRRPTVHIVKNGLSRKRIVGLRSESFYDREIDDVLSK
jgi:thioredoxin